MKDESGLVAEKRMEAQMDPAREIKISKRET
jgi:hypothetical protein